MLREVVVAEYCLYFCLCLTTLVLRYLIHRRRSIRIMWKSCPALCALLMLVVPMCFLNLSLPVVWTAVVLGILDNVPQNAYLLCTSILIAIAIDYVYCSLTISIFLQRIFYLLFPLRDIRKFNFVVFSILSAIAVGCAIVSSFAILTNLSPNEQPLPPGCFSFNCMANKNHFTGIFPMTMNVVFSGVIITVGTFMFALICKQRKQRQSATSVKVRKFTLYVFYIRLAFETIPCALDVAFSQTTGIQLGRYIGAYAALGSILDISATTALYYKLFSPPKMIVPTFMNAHGSKELELND